LKQPDITSNMTTSLSNRIFLRVGLTMLASILFVVSIIIYQFQNHIDTLRDRSLQGQLEDIIRHIEINKKNQLQVILPPRLQQGYESENAQFRFIILNENAIPLAASKEQIKPLDENTLNVKERTLIFFENFDEQFSLKYYGVSKAIIKNDKLYYVQVAQSGAHKDLKADTILEEFIDQIAWVILIVFAAILFVIYLTIKSTLKPLSEISKYATAIQPNTFHLRLPVNNIPREIIPMVNAMNDALQRLEDGYRIQREFTANAAHEMRTPLAVLHTHLETIDDKEISSLLLKDIRKLERMFQQLLKLAQMDNFITDKASKVNLYGLVGEVALDMAHIAIEKQCELEVLGDTNVEIIGDKGVLAVALRNLIENAIFYSPSGTPIEITIDTAHSFSISNHGPPISHTNQQNLFKRFWRANPNEGSGAGLGLSIVARIVEAHDAHIQVTSTKDGLTTFTIKFSE